MVRPWRRVVLHGHHHSRFLGSSWGCPRSAQEHLRSAAVVSLLRGHQWCVVRSQNRTERRLDQRRELRAATADPQKVLVVFLKDGTFHEKNHGKPWKTMECQAVEWLRMATVGCFEPGTSMPSLVEKVTTSPAEGC